MVRNFNPTMWPDASVRKATSLWGWVTPKIRAYKGLVLLLGHRLDQAAAELLEPKSHSPVNCGDGDSALVFKGFC